MVSWDTRPSSRESSRMWITSRRCFASCSSHCMHCNVNGPITSTLVVYGYNADWKHLLAQSYYEMAASQASKWKCMRLCLTPSDLLNCPAGSCWVTAIPEDAEQRRQANETKLLAKRAGESKGLCPNPPPRQLAWHSAFRALVVGYYFSLKRVCTSGRKALETAVPGSRQPGCHA